MKVFGVFWRPFCFFSKKNSKWNLIFKCKIKKKQLIFRGLFLTLSMVELRDWEGKLLVSIWQALYLGWLYFSAAQIRTWENCRNLQFKVCFIREKSTDCFDTQLEIQHEDGHLMKFAAADWIYTSLKAINNSSLQGKWGEKWQNLWG